MNTNRIYSFFYVCIDHESGVTEQQFINYVREKSILLPIYPNWRWTLLHGLRGERKGQFLMLFEIKDQDSKDVYLNQNGEKTPQAEAFWKNQNSEVHQMIAEWKKLASFFEIPTLFSDYHLIAENTNSTILPGPRYEEVPNGEKKSRIIGIHNLALRAGVTENQFEEFILKNIHRVVDYPDWKFHLLKGYNGNRLDKYVVMMEIENEEALNRFYPEADIGTPEVEKFAKTYQDTKLMYEEWKTMASFSGSPQLYTDYIAVAECGSPYF